VSKVLVVDDEQSICWGLSRLGNSIGHEVVTASSAEQALEIAEVMRPDVIVLDVRLPGMDGLSAIERLREPLGQVPIIVITAYGDLETAVEAVRNGAFEYIVKPFDLDTVQRALERALTRGEAATIEQPRAIINTGLIGRSPAMQEVFKRIALAASSNAGVLLCGESGTGKELAARAIHQYSDRSGGPFVAVNLAALNPALAESELFGHTRGSFTGADQDRRGLLVQADGGTLFLDEVADIPIPLQVKLLRALEQREVLPVGSGDAVQSDFRIVSATHCDLLEKVRAGAFRHDLYFRLGAFRIEMPPLRERQDDVCILAEHFIASPGTPPSGNAARFSQAAIDDLKRRPWYGNVRELRNAVEHALIVSRGGLIEPEHLPEPTNVALFNGNHQSTSPMDSIGSLIRRWAEAKLAESAETDDLYEQLLRLVEPQLLAAALEKHRGQCVAAARQLGLHRTTLRKKLDDYGIGKE
jgi:DNA-binding NtrC family response regulator